MKRPFVRTRQLCDLVCLLAIFALLCWWGWLPAVIGVVALVARSFEIVISTALHMMQPQDRTTENVISALENASWRHL